MEQDKNKGHDKDKLNKDMASENLDKKEFDIPDTERKSEQPTANDNQDESSIGSDGGKQSGKVSSTTGGNQQRGGDETYSNVYKGKDKGSGGSVKDNEDKGSSGIGNEGDKDRRGADNMIDDKDDDPDTGSGRADINDFER